MCSPVRILVIHYRRLWITFHFLCIKQDECYSHDVYHHPAEHPVAYSREERHFRNSLSDAYGKRIQYRAGESDVCCDIDHTDADDGVVAHRYSQRYDDDDKCNTLLAHAEYRAEQAEEQHYQDYDNIIYAHKPYETIIFQAFRKLQKREDSHIDGVALIHNPEGSAYYQYENYYSALFFKSFE